MNMGDRRQEVDMIVPRLQFQSISIVGLVTAPETERIGGPGQGEPGERP